MVLIERVGKSNPVGRVGEDLLQDRRLPYR
jgi:hypothetical protein